MNRKTIDELKQQIPLLDYLQAHGWQAARSIRGGRLMGLCPLHTDHRPSFLADPYRNLFYCYGCARGGDVIRFTELYHQVKFPQAVAWLREWRGVTPLLDEVLASTGCSYPAIARRSLTYSNADSTRQKSLGTCALVMHLADAFEHG